MSSTRVRVGCVISSTRVAFSTRNPALSNIGFITVHGLNEGHITPYTDIEFQLTKYQTYITMKS